MDGAAQTNGNVNPGACYQLMVHVSLTRISRTYMIVYIFGELGDSKFVGHEYFIIYWQFGWRETFWRKDRRLPQAIATKV